MNFIVHKMRTKKIYSNDLIKYRRRSKLVDARHTHTNQHSKRRFTDNVSKAMKCGEREKDFRHI